MSLDQNESVSKKNAAGRNKQKILCMYCPSKILNPGAATHVNTEYALPYIHRRGQEDRDKCETITDYWLIEDMYTFENIGVSNTVDNVKYLACADCEQGPVGWHDLTTKKSYIALSRVKYE
ncbi:guanine nucleotide exchange factor MSS4 [Orussus abietinus]|uniref:guanine nucleotide exchange factor MSS4 n=1 Tax=Orussus abietinus TaxID=222816 RepID=UPI000625581E|nr:guanine nucleotide exchange factor MSS4 [Orussus abietinus]XP_023288187.1 guanine nucleotide exchange factor MSS4 [Orussus abietinus]